MSGLSVQAPQHEECPLELCDSVVNLGAWVPLRPCLPASPYLSEPFKGLPRAPCGDTFLFFLLTAQHPLPHLPDSAL